MNDQIVINLFGAIKITINCSCTNYRSSKTLVEPTLL